MSTTRLKVPPQPVPAFRVKRWDKLLTSAQYWQMASIGTGLPLVGVSSRQYQPSPPVGRVSAFVRDGIIVESRLSSLQPEFPPELTLQDGEFPELLEHAKLIARAKLDSTYGLAHAFPFFEIGRGWNTPRALAILGSLTDSEQNAVMAGQTLKVSNLRSTTRQAIHYGLLLESNFAVDGLLGRHGAPTLMSLENFEMKLTQGKRREVTLMGTGRKAIETEFELTVAPPGSSWPKWEFSWMSSAD